MTPETPADRTAKALAMSDVQTDRELEELRKLNRELRQCQALNEAELRKADALIGEEREKNTRLTDAMRNALLSAEAALRALDGARGTRSATAVAQTGVAIIGARNFLRALTARLLGALPPQPSTADCYAGATDDGREPPEGTP